MTNPAPNRFFPQPCVISRGILVCLALLVPLAAHAMDLPPAVEQAEKAAVEWLRSQMVPNDAVPTPDPSRRRLLLSYRVPAEDAAFKYIYGRSFIYDDAAAAIALTMLGDYRQAEYVLNSLTRLVRADGSMWFAYNTQNSWPGETDHEGAIIRMGSVAWVGYALTYYMGARAREDASFLTRDPVGIAYLRSARAIAGFLLANQVRDSGDPRHGLITGGEGASTVTLPSGAGRPSEVYSPQKVTWVSMEHNIDAWFFLRDLVRLAPNAGTAAATELVRAGIGRLWSEKDGQFFQGIGENRRIDSVLPLDGASWGALFLLVQGQDGKAKRCMESLQARFRSEAAGVRGFRPYGPEPIYKEEAVGRFYFPERPGRLWEDLPLVWGEGSLGAAAAMARGGNPDEALKIIDSSRGLAVDGGLRYATAAVPYLFTDYPSVASTSWFIIAAEILRGGPAADSFWGK
jgi:hypothetical protein